MSWTSEADKEFNKLKDARKSDLKKWTSGIADLDKQQQPLSNQIGELQSKMRVNEIELRKLAFMELRPWCIVHVDSGMVTTSNTSCVEGFDRKKFKQKEADEFYDEISEAKKRLTTSNWLLLNELEPLQEKLRELNLEYHSLNVRRDEIAKRNDETGEYELRPLNADLFLVDFERQKYLQNAG